MRKFLAVLDDSRECANALRFAAMRASATQARFMVLGVISPDAIQHGIGVADLMRQEAEDRIQTRFELFDGWMRETLKITPELVIREGEPAAQVMALLKSDPEIGVLVLGAAAGKDGPGQITARLLREIGNLPCAVTLIPGELSRDRLEAIV